MPDKEGGRTDAVASRALHIPVHESAVADETGELATLISDMGAMGVRVGLAKTPSGVELVFEYDPERHKRNAGRKRKGIPEEGPLSSLDGAAIDRWLVSHQIEDVMAALRVSRSTAYRRVAEAKARFGSV